MEKAGRFSGTSSGAHYNLQLFALSLVGVDGVLGLLCFYFYFLRPRLHRKKEKSTFFHCTCPTCHRKFRYSRSQVGRSYQCHNCRRNFVFPDPEARVPPSITPAPKAQPHMAFLPREQPININRKRFFLVVASGSKRGLPIRVCDDLFLIGSAEECQLRSNHPNIAPRHCSLVTRLNQVFVRDWNSGLLTLVNGELLPGGKEWPVHAGDRITVGPLELLMQFRESSLAQHDLEEWALKCLDEDAKRDELSELVPEESAAPGFAGASDVAALVIAKMIDRKGVEQGRLRIFRQGDIVIIRFNDARLVEESEIALVRKEIQDHVDQPSMRILLDFKNVRRLSAAAVKMLVDLYRWLRGQQSRLALCRLAPELQGILETLNAIEPVEHFTEKQSAINSRW